MGDAAIFLERLFGYKPDESWILIWAKRGDEKVSVWCQTVEAAVNAVEDRKDNWDLYCGAALAGQCYGPHERLKADVRPPAGIVGLWADADLAGPEHAKKRYPGTAEDVFGLIGDTGYASTLDVHSGHGLQPWWAFKEPWMFDGSDECEAARRLLLRWKQELTGRAAARGFVIDPVFDLERVLRIPGTTNWKGEPVPTRILRGGGPVWSPGDFDERLPSLNRDPFDEAKVTLAGVALRAEATPPFEKFFALQENDPKFKQTVDRKRRDLASQSASEYDLSLASQVVRAGWSDQEIADLIVFCRRKHGDDLKLRETYYEPTIRTARQGLRHEEAVNVLEARAEGQPAEPDEREQLLETISQSLRVKVLRLVKVGGDDPKYVLETEKGSVELGPVGGVTSQQRFGDSVAKATEHVIPMFKAPRWKKILQALLDVVEHEETGPEATGTGVIRQWIETYFEEHPAGKRIAGVVRARQPFRDEAGTFLYLGSLLEHVRRFHGARVELPDLTQRMKRFGALRETVNLRDDHGHTTRSYWRLPELEE